MTSCSEQLGVLGRSRSSPECSGSSESNWVYLFSEPGASQWSRPDLSPCFVLMVASCSGLFTRSRSGSDPQPGEPAVPVNGSVRSLQQNRGGTVWKLTANCRRWRSFCGAAGGPYRYRNRPPTQSRSGSAEAVQQRYRVAAAAFVWFIEINR